VSAILPIARDKSPRRTISPGHRRVAAIDIGSNSIRQIVADVSPEGAIQVVDEMKAAPRDWSIDRRALGGIDSIRARSTRPNGDARASTWRRTN
jgi:hypothetical protein